MAKWVCDNPPAPGMYGLMQVYKRQGVTLGRVHNPLCGKRVKAAPEFAGTRKYADLLAIASPLASAVHRTLPENRQRCHYQMLAGKAIQWLKEGKSETETHVLLLEAAEVIRKELKPQKIKVRSKKKAERKPAFCIQLRITPSVSSRFSCMQRKKSVRRNMCSVGYWPHLVPQ
ncbi:hypothetical protein SAMN05421788_1011031 [Filimonas lacunae]|uniref:Uncharacterized protein n=1 Tax=Filimonas lacunae TaxID=477680 RepID=A0A173MPI1_9BACT|nr:hypothetical protein [Filimonas lacunae]BAV09595.1 hypothetical protein FLA_5646 [Filimonas lacunae]SIS75693.1 hypothetical protein SAMN05421788_1011031 [Filimonas lacunae]